MAVRRRAASWRDEHVDEAVASGGVAPGEKNGVGVADDGEVRERLVVVGPRVSDLASKVVGWNGRYGCLCRDGVLLVLRAIETSG